MSITVLKIAENKYFNTIYKYDTFRTTSSSSERETLMCLRGNNNRTNTGKIRRPERESNPRLKSRK